MESNTCCYIVSEDTKKDEKKQTVLQWLTSITQMRPVVKCKTKKDCDICSMCSTHCLTHYALRSHLDRRYVPTKWSQLGKKDTGKTKEDTAG